ncbi:MAG: alkaline phosphatase family protein [Bacteroidia bacterium]|nr:alkaline phosphatase family protein [Bacteroidia bacterium]
MKNTLLFVALLLTGTATAQQNFDERPKLVVGIVVDQMRMEYLYRFYAKFGDDGFKRFVNKGFVVRNGHYNYAPTVTGPGHASVYTGTTPAIHGVISNEWYDKDAGKPYNCVEDARYKPVGNDGGNGDVSPFRMLASTVTDELKLATQKHAKVIGMSFKDRGAVLPAGHMADGAYWFDSRSGAFISSTYYMNALPDWVAKFNGQKLADKYLAMEWKTALPIEQYVESGPDDSPYEARIQRKERPTFPYNLKELRKPTDNYDLLAYTPFANDYLTEFAKAALAGEGLGKDTWPDFLTVSYSTPDIVGHAVGPNAVEVEDIYIRLDKNLADLFNTLDQQVGANNYTVFLTADHGVADVPQYLIDSKVPAGYFSYNNVKAGLDEYMQKQFPGKQIVKEISNSQVYLNYDAFQSDPKSSGIELLIATEMIVKYLMAVDGVADVYSESVLRQANYEEAGMKGMIRRGYNPKRSGDIVIALEPGWLSSSSVVGTTHGSPYSYDTHVPMLFYGFGVKPGSSVVYHPITDIAPTISAILKIKFPNGCTGQPIPEVVK